MHDAPAPQPPLDRWGSMLRYVAALAPMLFYGVIWVWIVAHNPDRLPRALLDVGPSLLGLVLMRWRRRWPWQIAAVTALLTAVSSMATGPAQVAYVSLCTHRRWRQIVPITALLWTCMCLFAVIGGTTQQFLIGLTTNTTILGGLTVFGLYLRSLRDTDLANRRAEAHRVEQAKLAERAQIAQEMHDALAHRMSLLAMLAGGLAYRTDLGPDEMRQTAQAIQESAHLSLNELRTVLGTLRSDGATAAPQPTLADLRELFHEVRAAGQKVKVADTIEQRDLLPTQTGRNAYRVVQEALTNARKHAPGSSVTVELNGRPGGALRIRVTNPTPFGTSAGPGGRLGLVGLGERVRMAGGTIEHAHQERRFVLDVRLPWEA
ncbi:histidine kinase [Nonomuraea roseoviolacea subsp. roseoviolacea]|uniref:histidine kinase n=1 Tax=Nonomuraea roseoviolacea subsp. carminata TaxID=160689 RepID=A0ABT1JV96_9ACTN|nr:histidine kinase [Nonomuraea roseoviolacea]MCP2345673.1 signal transduction histidine kinase [Nonomuraea roseoviolacea subsp. carminata]